MPDRRPTIVSVVNQWEAWHGLYIRDLLTDRMDSRLLAKGIVGKVDGEEDGSEEKLI